MEFVKGFLLNNPSFRKTHLNISPFTIESVFKNKAILMEDKATDISFPWKNENVLITESGTQAIEKALHAIGLHVDDEVCILTTTGNKYISGCVTKSIEKYCHWSREINGKTKAFLVNHEFGFGYENLESLKKYELPIIEDCAYSMFSQNKQKNVGKVGDYIVYSLAKMFPVQAGGLLVVNNNKPLPSSSLSIEEEAYFRNVLIQGIQGKSDIVSKRRQLYVKFKEAFNTIGFETRFELNENDVPGAYLFVAPKRNLQGLKDFMIGNGVESSVFYGEDAFYFPCHQNMNENHIDYLLSLTTYFFNK